MRDGHFSSRKPIQAWKDEESRRERERQRCPISSNQPHSSLVYRIKSKTMKSASSNRKRRNRGRYGSESGEQVDDNSTANLIAKLCLRESTVGDRRFQRSIWNPSFSLVGNRIRMAHVLRKKTNQPSISRFLRFSSSHGNRAFPRVSVCKSVSVIIHRDRPTDRSTDRASRCRGGGEKGRK